MKVSVSLSEEDVAFLDAYAREHGYRSRSAALHHAVTVLRSAQLASAYEDAWQSWTSSGEAEIWDAVVSEDLEA
jgi:Arc/MetJ-type ribon-helix-helix transcriptional regulator